MEESSGPQFVRQTRTMRLEMVRNYEVGKGLRMERSIMLNSKERTCKVENKKL